MPMIHVQLSTALKESARSLLMKSLSAAVAEALGKPESYVMVVLAPEVACLMSGEEAPAAFVEVRSVGTIGAPQARALSKKISTIIHDTAGIGVDRIYANFMGVPGAMWGHGESTFG